MTARHTLLRPNFAELGARLSPYLTDSSTASAQHPKSGCLVILDIHGVLVERIAGKEKGRLEAARSHCSPWGRQKNRYSIWLRPHLRKFLEVVSVRHDIAIWSSAQPHTINDFVRKISREFRMDPPLSQRLSFQWDRQKCRPDPEVGRFATMKHMADLWDDPVFEGCFNSRNCLLLDDSPHKNRLFPNSGIVIPEYRADLLQNGYLRDDTLIWVLLYIEYLISVSMRVSEEEGSFDLSRSRSFCVTLPEFIEAGELEARQRITYQQWKRLESFAFVFLKDVPGSTNLPLVASSTV